MRYGIIGAMPEEIDAIEKLMTDVTIENIGPKKYIIGLLKNKNVVLTCSGIGKVSASIAATILITRYNCECIINTGVAGGLGDNVNTLDLVISTCTAQHDFDLTIFGYKLGQVPKFDQFISTDKKLSEIAKIAAEEVAPKYNFKVFLGPIISGDQFIAGDEQRAKIDSNFPQALATEMEGAAISQVCATFNIPSLIIRSISDNAKFKAHMTFDEMLPLATRNSQEILIKIIEAKY